MRRKLFLMILMIALTNMLTSTSNIQRVKTEPAIIIVPDDYPTIQEAINKANPRDTIHVKTGVYRENVVVDKPISVIGEDRDDTVIDGSTVSSFVQITANNVLISNFTMKKDSGIKLSKVENCSVYRNIFTDNGGDSIMLSNSTNNSLIENVVVNSARNGIILYNSNNNTAEKNEVRNAGTHGIALQNSYYCHIIENVVTGSDDDGIAVLASNGNLICRNIVTQGKAHGIRLDDPSDNNTIIENTIANNKGYGFWIWYSNNNVFYYNLCNNTRKVWVWTAPSYNSKNTWDCGYPSGGNYWKDYNATDVRSGVYQTETGSDGIGDIPYSIDADNTDNYPLMGMFSDFSATPEQHVQTICNSSISGFQFNGTAVSFNVAGENGTRGFCRICIPTALMNARAKVFVNGTEVYPTLLACSNVTHSYLCFNYTHSTQEVTIIPESASFLVLALSMMATLLAVIVYRRKHTR